MPQQRPRFPSDLKWNPRTEFRAAEANQQITHADQCLPLLQGQLISDAFEFPGICQGANRQKPWCHQPICRWAQYSPIWRQYCS